MAFAVPCLSQLHADSGEELVEGKGLVEVVGCAESETTQLGGKVRTRRNDHHGEVRLGAVQLAQDAQAVEPREEEVEQDEVVGMATRPFEPLGSVLGAVDEEAFSLQSSRQEPEDAGLVLDDQDPHGPLSATLQRAVDDVQMTPA